jgi:hypothetical protein
MALPNEPQALSGSQRKEILTRLFSEKETHPVVERPTVPEVPKGTAEKVEAIAGAEITLPQPVTDDQGQVLVDDAAPQQVTVVLPLTEEEIQHALHLKVIHSIRWLAEWSKRLVKKTGQKFAYKLSSKNK